MEHLESVGIAHLSNVVAGDLSYGHRRALEIATTLALEPEVILLDEPTAGNWHGGCGTDHPADPRGRKGADRGDGGGHNLGIVSEICDEVHGSGRGQDPCPGVTTPASWANERGQSRAYLGRRSCLTRPPDACSRFPGLEAWYGQSQALYGIELSVNSGELVTLLGRNGAGKTTTLRSVMGMVSRRKGPIRINGVETGSAGVAQDRPDRHRLLPRGSRNLRQPDGREKPASARHRRRGWPRWGRDPDPVSGG